LNSSGDDFAGQFHRSGQVILIDSGVS
jgi:hypothetical protein